MAVARAVARQAFSHMQSGACVAYESNNPSNASGVGMRSLNSQSTFTCLFQSPLHTGTVLDSSTLIKVDDYKTKHRNHALLGSFPRVSGAEELRIADDTSIIGVAQPSLSGVRGILNALNAGRSLVSQNNADGSASIPRKVVWISLREEPLLYLNGRPVVLRDRDEPFRNMETLKGISESRLIDLEWRLKEDVVSEAQRLGGSVLLHEEVDANVLSEMWESAPPYAVMTPEEVFFQLRQEGYRVKHARLPCTSGEAPTPIFFDELLKHVQTMTDRDTWIVFNCQSGNVRSTMAMIAASLIQHRRGFIRVALTDVIQASDGGNNSMANSPFATPKPKIQSSHPIAIPPPMSLNTINGGSLKLAAAAIAADEEANEETMPSCNLNTDNDSTERQLLAGWYLPVIQLIRLLVGSGRESKERVDLFVDKCSHISNLRTEVFKFRARAANIRGQALARLALSRASVALQRYMLLILFEAYIAERFSREKMARSVSNALHPADEVPTSGSFQIGTPMTKVESETYLSGSMSSYQDLPSMLQSSRKNKHDRSISREFSQGNANVVVGSSDMGGGGGFSSSYRPTFQEWVESRKEIVALLKNVHNEPAEALEAPGYQSTNALFDTSSESFRVISQRRGTMLNTDTILKLDHFEAQKDVSTGSAARDYAFPEQFAGENAASKYDDNGERLRHNFRRVAGMRVYGVSTLPTFHAKNLVRFIQTAHGAKTIMFCNLREEPLIFINSKPFVMRSVHRPFRNLDAFANIDIDRLEKAEAILKNDVLEEAKRCAGRVLVHTESSDGSLRVVWEEIEDDDDVQTPKEVFRKFQTEDGLPVRYARIPMTPESVPGLSDIDQIIRMVRANKGDAGMHFVFFCQRGRGRSTLATILACLELDEFIATMEENSEALTWLRSGGKTEDEQRALLSMTTPATTSDVTMAEMKQDLALESSDTDFPPLLSLTRVLRHGSMAKRWLDFTIDRCGAVFNLRKNILSVAVQANSARYEEQSHALIENALGDLRRYFVLLEVAGYLAESKTASAATPSKSLPEVAFERWVEARPELTTILREIRDEKSLHSSSLTPSASMSAMGTLIPSAPMDGHDEPFDKHIVAMRNRRVLVRGSILKTDHFPGCKRLPDPLVEIEGAPNFRSIWPEGLVDDVDLKIYGTGIPTESALDEILKRLSTPMPTPTNVGAVSTLAKPSTVIWINLREEPILYVNGRPFVLRRLDHPFANLEHTGISRTRVEEMEIRFKEDVLDEARSNKDGCVLIHEEDETGGLKPKWEFVQSVFTPHELFEARGRRVQYFRIPITDEQAPKPSAFDAIVDVVANVDVSSPVVFNCQMGRGRTTTGLVVAASTRLRKIGGLKRISYIVDTKIVPGGRKFRSKVRGKLAADLPDQNSETARELRGDFLAVLAEVRLMDEGAEAKRAMDALIDVCDSMQNLREAVREVKTRAWSIDLAPELRAEAMGVAEHYLRRYAHLVQFAAYLLTLPDVVGPKRMRFAAWLKARPELGNALKATMARDGKSLLSC